MEVNENTVLQNGKVEDEYVRIGTTLFRILNQPMMNGSFRKMRVEWKMSVFRQDHSKDEAAQIPKYDGFCTMPSHTDYRHNVNNFYNLYEPITHIPAEGDFQHICSLVEHIFGEQYELGMDYLQLLYLKPTQKLPILLLVSEERNTGKSTFLNFLLNRREDSERLKNLSTAHSYKMEAKGKDRYEVQFFAKFVLCSNNENYPVYIEPEETRYWVRKVSRLEKDDTSFLQKLKDEIPAFLYHLQHRNLTTKEESRMWFAPSLIRTEALEKIIRCNRSRIELDMAELLLDIMDTMQVDVVDFCINDLLALFNYSMVRVERHQVRNVLQQCWKLEPAPNALSYSTYQISVLPGQKYSASSKKVGRFYTVTREKLKDYR